MPTIDKLLDELGNASCFSKLDFQQGFHQIRMAGEDVSKTIFQTYQGHYKYKVMPFRLYNTLPTFWATMNDLLKLYLSKFVVVFFDDILVYSPSPDSHIIHLQEFLTVLA